MKITGFAFHVYHDGLAEWVTDYEERVDDIKTVEPEDERPLRLKLFKIIPEDKLPPGLVQVGKNYGQALKVYSQAKKDYSQAKKDYSQAKEDYIQASRVYDHASMVYVNVLEAYDFDAVHKELCPECPWDGKTIFPEKEVSK